MSIQENEFRCWISMVPPVRPKTTAEISADRQAYWDRIEREIDELYVEYLQNCGLDRPGQFAALYARYSTRHQDSIADQVRTLLEEARRIGVFVPRDLIFFDLAIRGFTKNRRGLDQLEAALREKRAGTLLLFATSRLFRKTYRTLEFVDRIHKGLQVRCIFVKSGVDTDDKQRWETLLATQAMVDQFVVTANVANIQAAHQGQLNAHIVHGILPFGYRGEPIEGQFTKMGRPRRRIVIDLELVDIVRQIFRWFTIDRIPMIKIARRLNAIPGCPLPPCARSGVWTKLAIKTLLTNTRYRGLWRYGVSESVYLPEQDYTRKRERKAPLAELQIDELRIVDDETWYAAQDRLARNLPVGGRPATQTNPQSRPKLLNGLLFCTGHGEPQPLQVGGMRAKTMACLTCSRLPADERALYSDLNRVTATRLICEKIQEVILSNTELVPAVVSACQAEADLREDPSPARLDALKRAIKERERSIDFTRRNPGQSEDDEKEAQRAIQEFQLEKRNLQAELRRLSSPENTQRPVPTEEEVVEMLKRLGSELVAAAQSDDESDIARAREILELVTGGFIEIHQLGERKKFHGWLQAKFNVDVIPYFVSSRDRSQDGDRTPVEVVVDLREQRQENPRQAQAWELFKQGWLYTPIAAELGCTISNVGPMLKKAAKRRGEAYVDGRSRRGALQLELRARQIKAVAPEATVLLNAGVSRKEIAKQLGEPYDIVARAVRGRIEGEEPLVSDGSAQPETAPPPAGRDGSQAA